MDYSSNQNTRGADATSPSKGKEKMQTHNIEKLIKDLIKLGEQKSSLGASLDIDDVLNQLENTLHEMGLIDNFTADTLFMYNDDIIGEGEVNEPTLTTAWNAIRSEVEGFGKRV